ncbi:hypothetical protein [Beijerinckia sp. L45]|uniref:hypothetical protein n=1 Tax=Beijerinckia sp. L45 TaxID=1641855 RepID=UPI00131D94B0|nr:hypothetical protein [Beijerinckia sp. L45]
MVSAAGAHFFVGDTWRDETDDNGSEITMVAHDGELYVIFAYCIDGYRTMTCAPSTSCLRSSSSWWRP